MDYKTALKNLQKMRKEDLELWKKKNNDYASKHDVFKNIELSAHFYNLLDIDGTSPEGLLLQRIIGKIIRIALTRNKKEIKNEPHTDSVRDARIYLDIYEMLYNEKRKQESFINTDPFRWDCIQEKYDGIRANFVKKGIILYEEIDKKARKKSGKNK